MLLVANSTPIVDLDSKLNSLRVNLERRLLLPTPESPISTTVKQKDKTINKKLHSAHFSGNFKENLQHGFNII